MAFQQFRDVLVGYKWLKSCKMKVHAINQTVPAKNYMGLQKKKMTRKTARYSKVKKLKLVIFPTTRVHCLYIFLKTLQFQMNL